MRTEKASNPQAKSNSAAAAVLRSLARQIVNLEDQRKELAGDIKDVKNEAAAQGFDKKALMVVVARMRETEDERAARVDAESIAEVYLASLGMLDGTPLGEAARRRFDPLESAEDDRDYDTGGEVSASPTDTETEEGDPPSGAMSADAIDAAREDGREAASAGERVFANPFVAGDPRRAAWDEGWCQRKGSDGMEIPEAWRRKKKAPEAGDKAAGEANS